MKLHIVAVGKVKEAYFRAAVDEYIKRIRRSLSIVETELREENTSQLVASIQKALPKRSYVIALTINGSAYSSEGFARWLEKSLERSIDLVFLIGGADGVPEEILKNVVHEELSLSKMTLPHRLARVVFVEQLYRAMTILRNEPYHH